MIGTPGAVGTDPVFEALGGTPFDRIILDHAEELTESAFEHFSTLASRWILAGDATPPPVPVANGRTPRPHPTPLLARLARLLDRGLFVLAAAWFVCGGLVMALGWWLAGLVAAITIVGLPWARSCFVIGNFSLWPFGREARSRRELTGHGDLGTGPLGLAGNVIWFLLAGWWLAIGHLTSALACFEIGRAHV